MPAARNPKSKPTLREAGAGAKARARANPPMETITVTLPKVLPEGVDFGYSRAFGGWVWKMKGRKGIHNLIEMSRSRHGCSKAKG